MLNPSSPSFSGLSASSVREPAGGRRYWMDGQMVPADEAALPLTDLAFLRGFAAFDALRTYGGVPFLLDRHLERLERSCALLFLRLPRSPAEIVGIVRTTLAAASLPDALIRIIVTGGDAAGFVPEHRERLMVLVDPLRQYPTCQFEHGVGLATSRLARTLPLVKSTSYLAGIRETVQARKQGFDEVVFCDESGAILEGTTFNVVAVRGRELISPSAGILPGVTGEHTLRLALADGFSVRREAISPAQVERADELFITSSTRELIPVSRVDSMRIGTGGIPGPVTRRLHGFYRDSTRALCGVSP